MNDIMITCKCPVCGKVTYVPCSYEQHFRYMFADALIQDVFPDMDAHTRETIISGMCRPCQDKFFIPDDDDEDYAEGACDGMCNRCEEQDTCYNSALLD